MKNIFIGIGVIVIIAGATYALVPRSVLKQYFQTGDKPTEQQFSNLIDSTANLQDDRDMIGLKEYNPSKDYVVGDTVVKEQDIYQAKGAATKITTTWRMESTEGSDGMPHTSVKAVVNGKVHDVGTFTGSCSEIGASGGIDGKGLLAGELSAVQCWFAGGGNEIGVFAHEDGGYEIMVGELGEGDAEHPFFRGNFKIKTSVPL